MGASSKNWTAPFQKGVCCVNRCIRNRAIHSPVFEPFDVTDSCRNTDAVNRVLGLFLGSIPNKDHPKSFVTIDATVDHDLVTVFKDVERNDNAGEKDEIGKGKESDFHQII